MGHRTPGAGGVVAVVARVLLTVVQLALVAGCVVLDHFASSRMGAARHVSWRSVQMEKAVDMNLLLAALALAVVVACVAITVVLLRRRRLLRHPVAVCAVLWVFAILFAGFALLFSRDALRAYYYLCFMLLGASVLQMAKTLIVIEGGKRRSAAPTC